MTDCILSLYTVSVQGRIHGLKSRGRIMARARNEEVGCGEGCPSLHRGGVWEGGSPPQKLFLIFDLKMARFCAFWELILLQ